MSAFWGDQFDSDGWQIPENFFDKISEIAHWIGNELEKRKIFVSCAKEKFGEARVYVFLDEDQYQDYREVGLEAIKRWPEYAKYIIEGADFPHLLGPVLGEFLPWNERS